MRKITMASSRRNCNPLTLEYAKKMREEPTLEEKILWEKIHINQLGVRIRRQVIILGFIVDFYCPQANLIIECDGRKHDKEKDKWRDFLLSSEGFKIVRFKNEDIRDNLSAVLRKIRGSLC